MKVVRLNDSRWEMTGSIEFIIAGKTYIFELNQKLNFSIATTVRTSSSSKLSFTKKSHDLKPYTKYVFEQTFVKNPLVQNQGDLCRADICIYRPEAGKIELKITAVFIERPNYIYFTADYTTGATELNFFQQIK